MQGGRWVSGHRDVHEAQELRPGCVRVSLCCLASSVRVFAVTRQGYYYCGVLTLPPLQVRRVFEALFECTLTMITKNFEDYPEHRLQFFALLHAIVNSCFK